MKSPASLALALLVAALCLTARTSVAQYSIDDGTAENSIGLTQGGTFTAFNSFATQGGADTITSISIAFSSPGAQNVAALNGTPFTAALWSDPNGDGSPLDAVLLTMVNGVIAGAGTNFFVTLAITPTLVTTANFFVGFNITHAAGTFPAAIDLTDPDLPNRSFITTGGINDLSGAFPIETAGFQGNWLIRANGVTAGVPESGTSALLLGLALIALGGAHRLLLRRRASS